MTARPLLANRRAPWLGALLLLGALPGYWLAPSVFFAAWLAGAWFGLGIVLGSLSWLWIHRLTGGRWGTALRPHVLRLAARLPRVLLLFLPLALGLPLLYDWAAAPGVTGSEAPLGRAFLLAWHAPPFVAARFAVYAIVWLVLARRAPKISSAGEAAASLMAHMGVTSLAAVDAIVSLVPGWSSSGFALAALSGQALGGGALAVALACRHLRRSTQPTTKDTPLTRDFGNLLLCAVMIWGYLAFMQLLIIWAENLPREISWFVPRLQTGWVHGGEALVVLQFALPLFLLLFRAIKDVPRRLEAVALALVAANAFDCVWLVLPSVAPHALAAWWLAPLAIAGQALLSFGGAARGVRSSAGAETSAPAPTQRELADGRA